MKIDQMSLHLTYKSRLIQDLVNLKENNLHINIKY